MDYSNQNIKLLLVGPLEEELDPLLPETLNTINHHPNIISVGYQNDVRPYFAISDALVFPSYREGFPNVVMQAGAMGLPSIVSDINGCNEIIIEGKNGTIISPKNRAELQKAMSLFLQKSDQFQSMQKNARELISLRYDQKVVWDAIKQEYLQLLAKNKITE